MNDYKPKLFILNCKDPLKWLGSYAYFSALMYFILKQEVGG